MEGNLDKLYKGVSAKYNIGTAEEFAKKMATPEQRKKFYDAVSAKGYDLGDYNVYEQRLSTPQKKSLSPTVLQKAAEEQKQSASTSATPAQSTSTTSAPSTESIAVNVGNGFTGKIKPSVDVVETAQQVADLSKPIKEEMYKATEGKSVADYLWEESGAKMKNIAAYHRENKTLKSIGGNQKFKEYTALVGQYNTATTEADRTRIGAQLNELRNQPFAKPMQTLIDEGQSIAAIQDKAKEVGLTPKEEEIEKIESVPLWKRPFVELGRVKTVGEAVDAYEQAYAKTDEIEKAITKNDERINKVVEDQRKRKEFYTDATDEDGNDYKSVGIAASFINGVTGTFTEALHGINWLTASAEEKAKMYKEKSVEQNILFPERPSGTAAEVAGTAGSLLPYFLPETALSKLGVTGTAKTVGSIAANGALMGLTNLSAQSQRVYDEIYQQTQDEEAATKAANKTAIGGLATGFATGAITLPVIGGIGSRYGMKSVGSDVAKQIATEGYKNVSLKNWLKATLPHNVATVFPFAGQTLADNVIAKTQGSDRELSEGLAEAAVGAIAIGKVLDGTAYGWAKMPRSTRDINIATLAKFNYGDVRKSIDTAVEEGVLDFATGGEMKADLDRKKKALGAIPKGLSPQQTMKILPLVEEIQSLQGELDKGESVSADRIKEKISDKKRELDELISEPLSMIEYSRMKELGEKEKGEAGITELEREELRHLTAREKGTIKVSHLDEKPLRVTYADGRTGIAFKNREGDIEFVPDGNSSGLIIDKGEKTNELTLRELGFTPEVSESISKPDILVPDEPLRLGSAITMGGKKYEVVPNKNAPSGIKYDGDGNVRVVYLKGKDGRKIVVGASDERGAALIAAINKNKVGEANKIAEEAGFDHAKHLLNTVNKESEQKFETVQDVPKETVEKLKEVRRKNRPQETREEVVIGEKKVANNPLPLESDYDVSKETVGDAVYDIANQLGFIGNQIMSGYKTDGNTVVRIKDHTPDWGYFESDIADKGLKKVVNVTVGDYKNIDKRLNKTSLDAMREKYPDVEFVDIRVEDGESVKSAIEKIRREAEKEIITEPKTESDEKTKAVPEAEEVVKPTAKRAVEKQEEIGAIVSDKGKELEEKVIDLADTKTARDSKLKEQKKDLLEQMDEVEKILFENELPDADWTKLRELTLGGTLLTPFDKVISNTTIGKLEKAGYKINKDAQVEFEVIDDGVVKIPLDGIIHARELTKREFPENTEYKTRKEPSKQPKLRSIGKYKTKAQADGSIRDAEDNLATAKNGGNKKQIELFEKQLELEREAYKASMQEYESAKKSIAETEEKIQKQEFTDSADIREALSLKEEKEFVAEYEGVDKPTDATDYAMLLESTNSMIADQSAKYEAMEKPHLTVKGTRRAGMSVRETNKLQLESDKIKSLEKLKQEIEDRLREAQAHKKKEGQPPSITVEKESIKDGGYKTTSKEVEMADGEIGVSVTIEKPNGERVQLEAMYPEDVEREVAKKIRGFELQRGKEERPTQEEQTQTESQPESPIGKQVTFTHAGGRRTGEVISVEADGKYKVKDANGIKYFVKPENTKEIDLVEQAQTNFENGIKELADLMKSPEKKSNGTTPPTQYGFGKQIIMAPFKLLGLGDAIAERFAKKMEDGMANAAKRGMDNSNKFVSEAATQLQGLFRQLPLTAVEKTMRRLGLGKINVAPLQAFKFYQNAVNIVGKTPESLRNVHMVLDPEVYAKRGITPIVEADLSPAELNLYNLLRTANNTIHDWHYANGRITEEVYLKNKGKYMPRVYEEIEFEGMPDDIKGAFEDFARQQNYSYVKERKAFEDVMGEHSIIEDPVYGTAMRMGQMLRNQAVMDYADQVFASRKTYKEGDANIPSGYVKLEGKSYPKVIDGKAVYVTPSVYGKLTNRYVPREVAEDFKGYTFINEATNYVYNALKRYDKNALRKIIKKKGTIWNPVTQLGNIGTNYVFAMMNGIDPLTFQHRKFEAADAVKNMDNLYMRLVQEGVLGTDITTKDLKESAAPNKPSGGNILTRIDDTVTDFYSSRDDIAKVAAYLAHTKDYGRSHEEAVQRVSEGFQNYNNVGRFYDFASKTPIIGNPYIKFKGDLLRIMKNNFANRPLTNIALMAALNAVASGLSELSEEDEEVRKVRERSGFIPKVPLPDAVGGDIPLVWKTPIGEVNAARLFSPFNVYDMGDRGSTAEEISQFLPYQVKEYEGASTPLPSIADPFLGTYIQLAFDKDFRGKPILDPQDSKWRNGNGTADTKAINAAVFVARQQIPFFQNAHDMYKAINEENDYYGRNRGIKEALLNNIVKVQKFDRPEAIESLNKEIDSRMYQLDHINGAIKAARTLANKNIRDINGRQISRAAKDKQIAEQTQQAQKRISELLDEQAQIKQKLLEPKELLKRLGASTTTSQPQRPFLR